MLKRTAARLLLFGIPFTVSYLVGRPPAPRLDQALRAPIQNHNLVIAVDRAGRIVLTERPQLQETSGERLLIISRSNSFRTNQ